MAISLKTIKKNDAKSTICLNMIVKNEAHVIRRCLNSVMPHIHSWVIMDTGSTDGTQDIIRDHLKGIPGELFERPWTDFAQSRNEAMERVGKRADYILFMDADDFLDCPEGFKFPELRATAYRGEMHFGEIVFFRDSLVSTEIPWRYEGAIHESLINPKPYFSVPLPGFHIQARSEGARSKDPDRYKKDAALLEQALKNDPYNTRNAFNLARAYDFSGSLEPAIDRYNRRIAMGGWDEEIYFSLFSIARIMEVLRRPGDEIIEAYLKAHNFMPSRAESIYFLSYFLGSNGDIHAAYQFSHTAMSIPQPRHGLLLYESVYQWRALDIFVSSAFYCRRFPECLRAGEALLLRNGLPDDARTRVEEILRQCALAISGTVSQTQVA